MNSQNAVARTNHELFVPRDTGSPVNGLLDHLSRLNRIARLDYERCGVAGEVVFAVAGDEQAAGAADEEARIATLAYAVKRLGDPATAAEFMRRLDQICDGGDGRFRRDAASHYYREIATRGAHDVLGEMASLAEGLAPLGPPAGAEEFDGAETSPGEADDLWDGGEMPAGGTLLEREVAAVSRLVGGRRRLVPPPGFDTCPSADEGTVAEDSDDTVFASGHGRTVACGKLDRELTEEDLPERAAHLARELRKGYASGVPIDEIRADLDARIEVLFPVKGRTATGARFYSHANRMTQNLTREILDAVLADCGQDFHLGALRASPLYRLLHQRIRRATDAAEVGETMRRAYSARTEGALSLKHFTVLKLAADLQRLRLDRARLSPAAYRIVKEVERSSPGRLRYLRWAFYGGNRPDHPIHSLPLQEKTRIWEALKAR